MNYFHGFLRFSYEFLELGQTKWRIDPITFPLLKSTTTMLSRFIGLALILLAVYLLGQNIYFTTNVSPYWWRGIAADGSVLFLTSGIVLLFFLPSYGKSLGWIALGVGIFLVFLSSRAILNPTSLWQFCLSIASFVGGYQLITMGRINI